MRRSLLWRRAAAGQLDCRRAGAWLQAYLDGELDRARHRAVARHLRECRRCGMEAATYRELRSSLRRGPRTHDEAASVVRLRDFAERLAAGDVDLARYADGWS